jgi:hypothetical protein
MAEIIANNIDEFGDFWAKDVYPFSKPIVEADSRGRPCPTGSGVLVAYDEKYYLLTAHHVTARSVTGEADGALYTFVPEQVEIGADGQDYHYLTDPFDLSLTQLPGIRCRSLRLPQHLALDVQSGERCLLLGYPARSKSWDLDQTKHTLRPKPLPYMSNVFKATPERFSIRLSRKHVRRGGKEVQRIGKLNGLSGGGVFVLRNQTPALAGIVIEYHSNSAEIVCTSSKVVWAMVKQLGHH